MALLETLEELRQSYKTLVKPDIEKWALTIDSKYNLVYICTQIIGLSEEIAEHHSGLGLLADANLVYKRIIQQTEPPIALLNNFEVGLAQVRLSIETDNRYR